MSSNNTIEIEKIIAIQEEIEASYLLIIDGIKSLNSQTSSISNNHSVLQLLSSGFERLLKILLLIKEKYLTDSYPAMESKKNYFYKFDNGHGIEKMLQHLLEYSKQAEFMNKIPMVVEDLEFLRFDTKFNDFIKIITDFSKHQRYYYIDTIVKKKHQENNTFEKFKLLIDSYSDNMDLSNVTYKEEDKYNINQTIVTIEKGIRAISRFFTHGFGKEGQKNYGNFVKFILLKDEDLGKMKYLISKVSSDDYLPMKRFSFKYFKLLLLSNSKIVNSSDCKKWFLKVKKVKVFKYDKYLLIKIKNEVYALNGSAIDGYKIPIYHNSKYHKARDFDNELLKIAENL